MTSRNRGCEVSALIDDDVERRERSRTEEFSIFLFLNSSSVILPLGNIVRCHLSQHQLQRNLVFKFDPSDTTVLESRWKKIVRSLSVWFLQKFCRNFVKVKFKFLVLWRKKEIPCVQFSIAKDYCFVKNLKKEVLEFFRQV